LLEAKFVAATFHTKNNLELFVMVQLRVCIHTHTLEIL